MRFVGTFGRVDTPKSHPYHSFMPVKQKRKSTTQLLVKIQNRQYLYQHSGSGIYYFKKKVRGKPNDKTQESLKTTDRNLAERRLRNRLRELEEVDTEVEHTSLEAILNIYEASFAGKSRKTLQTNKAIVNQFRKNWSHGLNIRIADIRPSQLNGWLATLEGRLKNTSYNRYAGFLKQIFDIAVNDRIIPENQNPFNGVKTRWKKPQRPERFIPTEEQFLAIIHSVRSQRYNAEASASADFLEFLGRAGLGQAEASSLTWGDVDFEANRLAIRRHKTDKRFYPPIYPKLKPLLERLYASAKSTEPNSKVFAIQDGKKALAAACERLNFRRFTQRNLRQVLIRELWQARIDRKLIAEWQGHSDGGKLIIDTYTQVFGDDDADYRKNELSKLLSA